MATTTGLIQLSDGWTKIEDGGADYIISVDGSGYDIYVSLSASEPTAGTVGHRVNMGNPLVLNGLDGDVWARTDAPEDVRYIISSGTIDPARLRAVGHSTSIAILGDSITAQNYDWSTSGATNFCYFADNGYLTHAKALAGVDFDFKVDAGIGGNKTNDMLARLNTDVIAYSPDVCIVMGGVNDLNSRTVLAVYADLVAICEQLLFAGISVILAAPPTSSGSAEQYKGLSALRHKLENYANRNPGVWFWDAYSVVTDATSSTSAYKTNYSADGVHPSNLGAYYLGLSLAPILQKLFPARKLVCSQNDVFSSNSDSNQLLANPLMVGSASAVGTGTSGTRPTNWKVLTPTNQATGAATVYTAGGAANGGVGYKTSVGCTGAAAATSIHYFYSDDITIVDNNSLQGAARIKIVASSGLKAVYIKISRGTGAGKASSVQWNYKSSGSQDIVAGAEYIAAVTPPFIMVPGGAVQFWLQIELAAGGSATVEIEQAEVRDVGTGIGQTDNKLG